ncbi:MAG: hypothetical protein V3W44_09995 [Dehalococcoidales bacterium]
MELHDELGEVIRRAVLEKTLTEPALAQYTEKMLELKNLKEQNEAVTIEFAKAQEKYVLYNDKLKMANTALQVWIKRDSELLEREKKIMRLEIAAEYAELRRGDLMEVVNTVFRNTQVKETIMSSVPVNEPGYQGGCSTTVYHTKKEEIVKENI